MKEIMTLRPTRRSLMGSYRFSVMVKPKSTEFTESMSGSIDLYDGKHITQTHRYTTFDQLATIIMNFWEKALGTEVNIHRFSNWLSEYFIDIGIEDVSFYEMIENVRSLGKGIILESSGHSIREAKVRSENIPITAEDKKQETRKAQSLSESLEEKIGLKEETTPERVVKLTPPPKKIEEKKEEPVPPTDKLLKPTKVLKDKDITVVLEEDYVPTFATISGDPIVTKPSKLLEKPTTTAKDNLLRPSTYLKERETIDPISSQLKRPSALPDEAKIESVKKISSKDTEPIQKKTKLTSESLLRPSEYTLKETQAAKHSHHLVKPSQVIPQKELEEEKKVTTKIDPEKKKIPEPEIKSERKEKELKTEKKASEILPFEIEVIAEDELEEKPPIKVQIKTDAPKKQLEITDIMGVGDKTAMLLKDMGFETLEKITNAKPEELTKIPGIGITTAKKLIFGAKALMQKSE